MRKRLSSLLLSLTMLLPAPALGAEGTTFVDVSPGDWFAPYVEVCIEEGLMEGVGEGRFAPEEILSVQEALVLSARLLWRSDGGTGDLPAGGSVEEFWSAIYGDDPTVPNPEQWERYEKLSQGWSWDGIFYLTRRFREEYGSQSTHWYNLNNTAADREMFFHVLSPSVKAFDLSPINQIPALPDADRENDPELYQLYEAGIITGVDAYGFAALNGSLSRAECAAIAARILEPGLRVSFSPAPLPTEGYTLTYLMDGELRYPSYPVALVDIMDENGEYAVSNGFLTIDGQWLDWPEGTEEGVPSFGLEQAGDYVSLRPWDRSGGDYYSTKAGLMGRDGAMAIPFGLYDSVYPTADGHFIGESLEPGTVYSTHSRWFLLDHDGNVEQELPGTEGTPDCTWRSFNEGVCPWKNEDTGLWGYQDADGNWEIAPVFASAGSFCNGYTVVCREIEGKAVYQEALIDRKGEIVLPWGDWSLYPFVNSFDYEGPQGLIWFEGEAGSGWADTEGNLYPAGGMVGKHSYFHNGYLSCGGIYFDSSRQPVSQKFDYAGHIRPDGKGLVSLDGKIYQIQFEK